MIPVGFLVIACILLLTYIAIQYERNRRKWMNFYKIPGPPGLPILGNVSTLVGTLDELFKQDRGFAINYFPLYKISVMGIRSVILLHPEDIELVLSNMKHISKSPIYNFLHDWLGTGLLTSTGSKWQYRRKLLTPAFHFNILQEFINIFNNETVKLVKELDKEADKPYIDVVPPITHFTLMSINDTAMGTKINVTHQEKEEYKNAVYKMSHLIAYRTTKPWLFYKSLYRMTENGKEDEKTIEVLHKFSKKVIADRQQTLQNEQQKGDSYSTGKKMAMLDLLLTARQNGADIDDEGIREEVDTFMFEGHDTTATAICYILMLLANNPDVQEEVFNEILDVMGSMEAIPAYKDFQELKYTEMVLKECLRLYPSVPLITRVLGEEMRTKTGYIIPKGCSANISIFDLHHNPNVFPDPEKFDPDRFLPENSRTRHPFAYIPFSAGARNCIGQKFAMLELKAVLCGILRKFKLVAIDKPEDIKLKLDVVLRSTGSINIKFVRRK